MEGPNWSWWPASASAAAAALGRRRRRRCLCIDAAEAALDVAEVLNRGFSSSSSSSLLDPILIAVFKEKSVSSSFSE